MSQFLKRFVPVLALVAACWAVFLADQWLWSGHLRQHGILPRHLSGLLGILWAPFLHSSSQHLAANSIPLLILGGILCARSQNEFLAVSTLGILLGGAFTWIIGRSAYHVGASGLVFCLFGYIASMAYFRRTFGALLLSAVCILGYGGMLKGILPARTAVSWEGHAAGLVSGIILAWFSSKLRSAEPTPPLKVPEAQEPMKSTNRFGLYLLAFALSLPGVGF
jgi:membrane associated rhomboid family serine protease